MVLLRDVQDAMLLKSLLEEQSVWANVCTEPGMVALTASKAASLTDEFPDRIEVHLSGGVLKNALSAGLPNTSTKGPDMAAAIGAVVKKPEDGLNILGNATDEQLEKAMSLVSSGKVQVKWARGHDGVYARCVIRTKSHEAEAVVQGSHTNFVRVSFDGSVIESASLTDGGSSLRPLRGWTFHRLLEAVYSLDLNDLDWLLEGARACTCLAEKSQTVAERVILPVRSNHRDSGKDMSMIDVAGNVSKAICARMNGVSWPVVTSGGSGNQGIMVGIPVLALGTEQGLSKDQLIRALAIAHSVNILVKASIGEVSSSCGGLSAGAGLASAVCWMLGGNEAQMKEAASQVLASLCGMLCDGAKATCALKGSTAIVTAMTVGAGAVEGGSSIRDQGIVGGSFEETLSRLAALNSEVINRSDALLFGLLGLDEKAGA
jgi:L-cysteine desulfidase